VVVAVLASTLPRWRDGALLRAAQRGWAERCQQRGLEVPEGSTAVVGLALMRSWVLLQEVPRSTSAWQHQSSSRTVTEDGDRHSKDKEQPHQQAQQSESINRRENASGTPTATRQS
jgi:hypothetical protein